MSILYSFLIYFLAQRILLNWIVTFLQIWPCILYQQTKYSKTCRVDHLPTLTTSINWPNFQTIITLIPAAMFHIENKTQTAKRYDLLAFLYNHQSPSRIGKAKALSPFLVHLKKNGLKEKPPKCLKYTFPLKNICTPLPKWPLAHSPQYIMQNLHSGVSEYLKICRAFNENFSIWK